MVGSVPPRAAAGLPVLAPPCSRSLPGSWGADDPMRRNALLAAIAGMWATGTADDGVGAVVGPLTAVITGADGVVLSVGITGSDPAPAGTVRVGAGIGRLSVGTPVGPGVPAGAVLVGIGSGLTFVGVVAVGTGPGRGLVTPGGGGTLAGAGPAGAGPAEAGPLGAGLGGGDCRQPHHGRIRGPVAARAPGCDGAPPAVRAPAARPAAGAWGWPALSAVASGAPRAVPAQEMASAAARPVAAAAGRIQAARSAWNCGGQASGRPVLNSRRDAIPRAAR